MASSPSGVAKILAPLSKATEPPVNIGRITRSGSKVVLKGCLLAILQMIEATRSNHKERPAVCIPPKKISGLSYR